MTSEFMYSVKLFCVGVAIGVVLSVLGFVAYEKFFEEPEIVTVEVPVEVEAPEPVITMEYVDKKLENISELSTAEMTYNGLYTIVEGNIPFITQKGFSMTYEAQVKAGIDASAIEVEVTDEEVIVTLPQAEIQMSYVNPDSIQFYDEKMALFNWTEKTDVTEAISSAEADVAEKADLDGLLERASKQAEYIVKGLLEDAVGDLKVVVKQSK
ncbi:MAG: DUF4230 domain-containing protein [Lachnospiraceae bacterium]|nr:DUF4230 domain-containing protein [Lachnospiraceae bacterium]